MLDGAFSFRGRIGRLNFFLAGLLMVPAALVVAIAAALLLRPVRHDALGLAFCVACAVVAVVPFAWFSLSLHIRRIRDIGWDPVVVIVGWVALNVGDPVLAHLAPGLATGAHHAGTIIGTLADAALSLALLFWPGTDRDVDAPPPARTARAEQVAARPTVTRPAARPAGFGRRGLS